MTYCMWRNSFFLDLIEKKVQAIWIVCKRGTSKLLVRKETFRVPDSKFLIKLKDPTWKEEFIHFNYIL